MTLEDDKCPDCGKDIIDECTCPITLGVRELLSAVIDICEESGESLAMMHYKGCLKKLEALIAEGKDDSPEAEALRDEMDFDWEHMDSIERDELNSVIKWPEEK